MKNWLKKVAQLSILFVLFITLIFDGAIAYAANEVNKKTNPFHSAAENTNELVFKDVPPSYWAYKDIKRLKELKIVSGKGDGLFGPEDRLTREQFLSMVVLQQGYKIVKDQETFKDVPRSKWSNQYIETAIKEEIIEKKEYGDNFKPEQEISREEMAIVIAKVLKLKEVDEEMKFGDKGEFTKNPKLIAALVNAKIISGYPDGTFKPKQTLTRAESTAVIVKLLDYGYVFDDVPPSYWAYKDIKRLKEMKIVSGKGNGIFGPEDRLTREQFLAMIVLQQGYKIVKDQETFKDVPKSKWSNQYVETAIKEGIIEKKEYGDSFKPEQEIPREEMAIIIAKVLKLKEVNEEIKFGDKGEFTKNPKLIAALVNAKIISGYPDGTFKPKQTLTRAESTAVVSKVIDFKKDEPTTGDGDTGGGTGNGGDAEKAGIVYKKNVYEVKEQYKHDIEQTQTDTFTFKKEAAKLKELKNDNILILPPIPNNPLGVVIKIISITDGSDGEKVVKAVQPDAKEVIEKIDVKEKISVTRDNAEIVYLAEGVTLDEKQPVSFNPFQQQINGEKEKNQYVLQGPEHFLQRAFAEYDVDKKEFSTNTNVKITGKDLGINEDLTFALKGKMKIKNVDVDILFKDVTNLDELKFILKGEVENNVKYTFDYSHCVGAPVNCDKKKSEGLTFEEWKEMIEKKGLSLKPFKKPLFMVRVPLPAAPAIAITMEASLVLKADLSIGVEVDVKQIDSFKVGIENGGIVGKHEQIGPNLQFKGEAKIDGKAGIDVNGGLTLANITLIGANFEAGLKLEALARASWGIKDVDSSNINAFESICAKGSLGYYIQAGLKASILKADILSIKKSLIDINEEIGKISNCEKYDLQSAQDYLLLEEGEDTNLKVVKRIFDENQLTMKVDKLSKDQEIRVSSENTDVVEAKRKDANDFSIHAKSGAKEKQKVDLLFELVEDGKVLSEIKVPVYIVKPTKLQVDPEKTFVMKKQKEQLQVRLAIPVPEEIIEQYEMLGLPIEQYRYKEVTQPNLLTFKSSKDFVIVNELGEVTVKDDAKIGDTTEINVAYKGLTGKVSAQVSGSEEDKRALSGLSLQSAQQLILDAEQHANNILQAAVKSPEEEKFEDLQKQMKKFYEPKFTGKQFEKAYKYNRQWILNPYYLYPVTNVYNTEAMKTFSSVSETPSTLSVKVSVPVQGEQGESFTYTYDLVKKDGSWYLDDIN
ncbi:S-layer homology domain-containing protein [Bacillus cereus]|uniref:S-layer homology domain-containing protein n=1 Tax=Bacillus cereus TaxID=1396 RepID=UPI000BF3BAE3|nr:S-layer homology domain-containing protein [Bacillus cereus]PER26658.1 S-layer protein [Bacillus cereus]